jgi:TonB family protein
MKKAILGVFLTFGCQIVPAQWIDQDSGTKENLRGLSAVNDSIVWASGTHGTSLKTSDGGAHWQAAQVPNAESLDFRDVEAFSGYLAYLLAAGPGEQSRIYKTNDGGKNWTLQFTNKDPKGFFDCMAFWDRDHGIALGDPVNGKFQLIKTEDGGKDWKPIAPEKLPAAIEGEGAFAASGTCVTVRGKKNVWFATGGNTARVFRSNDAGETWSVTETPIVHGPASAGIFSVAFRDDKHGVIAGGDYKKPDEAGANLALTSNGGETWTLLPLNGPNSFYYSAALYDKNGEMILAGTAGALKSLQTHTLWQSDRSRSFNALAAAGNHIFAVGLQGRVSYSESGSQFPDLSNITVLTDTHGVDLSSTLISGMKKIRSNWYRNVPEIARRPLRKEGTAVVEFAIEKDGSISDLRVIESTHDQKMDDAVLKGITESLPLPALPKEFDQKELRVRARFLYNQPH